MKKVFKVLSVLVFVLLLTGIAFAQADTETAVNIDPKALTMKWAFVSSAVVMSLSAIAAAIAVAYIGSAAVGAMSEKPEVGTKAIMYVGLAEGLAILGFAISFMILMKV